MTWREITWRKPTDSTAIRLLQFNSLNQLLQPLILPFDLACK